MNDTFSDLSIINSFKEKTREMFNEIRGMNPDMIEDYVNDLIQDMIEDYDIDITIEDIIVSGSRCRGIETDGSDLDVILYFRGTEREDTLFNLLHEHEIIMNGISLDINPISQSQTGSLSEYLKSVDTFLAEKMFQKDAQVYSSSVPPRDR